MASDGGEIDFTSKEVNDQVFELMGKFDTVFHGYPRGVILLACMRSIAAMLGPSKQTTRDKVLEALPVTIKSTLAAIDEGMKGLNHG